MTDGDLKRHVNGSSGGDLKALRGGGEGARNYGKGFSGMTRSLQSTVSELFNAIPGLRKGVEGVFGWICRSFQAVLNCPEGRLWVVGFPFST